MAELIDARILVVDDEPANVRLLQELLDQPGYKNVRTTTEPRQVRTLYEEFQPDLILLDLMMPQLDGVAVMAELPIRAGDYMPVLVLTADIPAAAKQRALAGGAKDFLTKPFDRTEVLLRIKNLLETRSLHRELERHNRSLEELVADRTQRLLQNEKVATVASLLAGVAHELNNPLAVVLGQAHMFKDLTKGSALATRAEKLRVAAERCGRIVRNFLALARQSPPERGNVQLNGVIQEAIEMLGYGLRVDSIEVRVDVPDELPIIWADAHQLHQVIVNVVANASHAMKRIAGPREISIAARVDSTRRRIQFTITDSGPGVPPEIRDKIFEPFFTTKPTGEGTGLGLSLCRSIIEDHGGTIVLDSEAGPGATFLIDFPVPASAITAAADQMAESLPAVGPKRILVIDDEPDIAEILVDILSPAGHHVDVASDGAAGLERITRQSYDLVLSDTKMPVLDGVGFYRQLERSFPALCHRLIFVTGDVLDRDKGEFLESTGVPFLVKPFDVEALRRLVHRLLVQGERTKTT
ncbi:MAG TPA: response regulator [Vicinamibacterales bacterium]|nr:response regulator [Vicinamibacterales bacterium]